MQRTNAEVEAMAARLRTAAEKRDEEHALLLDCDWGALSGAEYRKRSEGSRRLSMEVEALRRAARALEWALGARGDDLLFDTPPKED